MASEDLYEFSEADVTQAQSEVIYNFSDGNLLDDVKITRSKATENARRLSTLQGDFDAFRGTNAAWMTSVDQKLELILQAIGGRGVPQDESSQSLLEPVSNSNLSARRGSPFLIITYPDGKTEELRIPIHAEQQILSSSSHRESIRKLLLHFHEIKILRSYTRTGIKKCRKRKRGEVETTSRGDEQVAVKDALPIRTRCAAIALYRRINPIDEILAGIPHLAAKEEAKRDHEGGELITAILNYYHCNFDEEGKRKVPVATPSDRQVTAEEEAENISD